MNSISEEYEPIHIVSPLKHSLALSKLLPAGTEVYLKHENMQPAASFKIRGIGRLVQKLKKEGYQRIIGASGGNAGLAISHASQIIGVPCTVFVPTTSPKVTIQTMKDKGAEVKIAGNCYADSELHALKEAEKPGNVFVHPYNDPEVWAGHSSMVHEIKAQLKRKPSAVVVSVGGGGLLLGVLQGLQDVGWQNVPVVAMETYGADCFNLAVKAKAVVVLEKITSIAVCLGARSVPPYLLEVLPNFNVISQVVSDPVALESCLKFADKQFISEIPVKIRSWYLAYDPFHDDERILVEPACGASLGAIYGGVLQDLHSKGIVRLTTGPVVVVVCGGAGVTLQMLHNWATQTNVKFPP